MQDIRNLSYIHTYCTYHTWRTKHGTVPPQLSSNPPIITNTYRTSFSISRIIPPNVLYGLWISCYLLIMPCTVFTIWELEKTSPPIHTESKINYIIQKPSSLLISYAKYRSLILYLARGISICYVLYVQH
jgi:hypothetical protein